MLFLNTRNRATKLRLSLRVLHEAVYCYDLIHIFWQLPKLQTMDREKEGAKNILGMGAAPILNRLIQKCLPPLISMEMLNIRHF